MPFTPAHAALLAPLKKTRIRIDDTAFLAGAMVPDFESFLLMRNAEKFGHTMEGVFLLDLPLALLLGLSFHALVKNSLITYLPNGLRARCLTESPKQWYQLLQQQPLLIIWSILLGTGSHLLWDGFTHAGGYAVHLFPMLLYNIKSLDYKPVFFIIQIISSIGGSWYVWHRIRKINPVPVKAVHPGKLFTFWSLLLLLTTLILSVRFISAGSSLTNADRVKALFGAGIYSLLLVAAGFTLLNRHKKRTA